MDAKTEGYLVAAIALIPLGMEMLQAPDLQSKVVGIIMVGIGLLAVFLRGNQKDAVAGNGK